MEEYKTRRIGNSVRVNGGMSNVAGGVDVASMANRVNGNMSGGPKVTSGTSGGVNAGARMASDTGGVGVGGAPDAGGTFGAIETNIPDASKDGSKRAGKKSKGLFIVLMIGLMALVAGGVFVVLKIINPGDKTDETADNTDVAEVVEKKENEDSTELAAGTVTTTIDGKTITYKAAYVVDGVAAKISSGVYESMEDDEAVFLVINGGSLKIEDGVSITKSGSANFAGKGENYSFYGLNSAIVVVGEGSSVSIDGAKIDSTVSGANAVVATNGGEVVIRKSTIATTMDNSRGLHATYGGQINADTTTITTKGGSSAALATDRGGGTVVADNMKLFTAGAGSPLIYSTGAITVSNSTGTATGAQIAVVEGKNSINMQGCEFAANGNGNRGSVDNAGVMIYQSMSGDASVGMGAFTATDSKLTVLAESSVYDATPFFFVTNTDATIDLTGSEIVFSSAAKFITAVGTDEWGRAGANGGKVTVSMSETTTTNTEVEVDEVSSIAGV